MKAVRLLDFTDVNIGDIDNIGGSLEAKILQPSLEIPSPPLNPLKTSGFMKAELFPVKIPFPLISRFLS